MAPTVSMTKGERVVMRVVLPVALVLMVLSFGALWLSLRPEWSPLGDYPIQTVDTQTVDGVPGFVVLDTGDDIIWPSVPVSGTKCLDDDLTEPVAVVGGASWHELTPNVVVYPWLSDQMGQRPPGCPTQSFLNPVIDDVRERVLALRDEGVLASEWRIGGTDTPVRDSGRGTPATWTTSNFWLIVKEVQQR